VIYGRIYSKHPRPYPLRFPGQKNKLKGSPLPQEQINKTAHEENLASSHAAVSLQIERLRKRYEFRNKEEIAGFIKANPQIESLLFEALEPITTVFPASQLYLEIYHNPEYQDSNQLVINIATELGVKEALKELDKIDRGWWGSNINRAGGKLTIDLEFE
jgi:hypothetical protein